MFLSLHPYIVGEVDFSNQDDMDYAIDKLDDTEFRNPFGVLRHYIRVKEARAGGGDGSGGRDGRDAQPALVIGRHYIYN